MGSWACTSQRCEAKLTDYVCFLHDFSLSLPAVVCYSWALNQLFTFFLQLNEWFRLYLHYNFWHHSLSLYLSFFFSLCLVLCDTSSGWSIPIFSNWWTSSRPKKSTSSSLNCEFWCLMSRGKGPSACLCSRSGLLNSMCWLYTRGEWAVVAWGLVDMRTALNSTHLVFRCDCLLAAPFSHVHVFLGNLIHFHGYAKCAILVSSFEDTWLVGLGILLRKKMIKYNRNIYGEMIQISL